MKKILAAVLLLLGTAFFMSLSLPVHNSRAADGTKIAIAYSGNVMGYMEPCG